MPELTIQVYARLLAHVACRRGAKVSQILADLQISPEELRAAETTFREHLAGAWDNRRGIIAMKFVTALGAELLRFGLIADQGGSADAVAGFADGLGAPEPRGTEVPSYLKEPRPQTPVSIGSAVQVEPPGPAAVNPVAAAPSLAETASMDLTAIVAAAMKGALPFAAAAAAATAESERRDDVRPTLELPMSGPVSPGGTMNADLSAVVAGATTGGLPWKRVEPPAQVSRIDEPDVPLLPLAVYAEISGALARGEPREEVLARHSLSTEQFGRLAQGWAQRFQQDPALLATFQELARSSAAGGTKPQ